MVNFDDQLEYFKLIGRELKRKIECFVIGGSAMMFYGAKVDTKDVDLVLLKEKDLDEIKNKLISIGFKEREVLVRVFRRYEATKNKPVMLERKEERFDLFLNEIISFKMSESIVERVKESHEFSNLIIKVVSPEDIILLKSATEREKDKLDALSLMEKFKINWDIIIEESIHQTKIGAHLFPVFLFDFLYELKEDLKADIPREVINKIRKVGEEMIIKKLRKKNNKSFK